MAVSTRTVKNKRDATGQLTGRAGTVYDVNIKYKTGGNIKTYSKKGFITKKEAIQHEAEMKMKLSNQSYIAPTASQSKLTVREYLEDWVEKHGNANLRPSTFAGYKSHIKNHILPYIGDVQLRHLTPMMLDDMFQKLFAKGLSQNTVRYAHRIIGVSMEHARKYHYIERNPARDIIAKFGKGGKTPDPYTVEQMQQLICHVLGSPWELIVILGGLYGLRLSEIIGLRWRNVDLKKKTFGVVEQLPYGLPKGTCHIENMAPVKSSERILPITEITLPYFEKQQLLQQQQKAIAAKSFSYYDNDLVIAKSDGTPERRDRVSANFGQLLRHIEMSHIRFHDLRHSAATNMHQLTGDFYTVGQILGHSLKGVGLQLNLASNLDSVTAQYVDVRLERKQIVLEAYHNAVLQK